MLLSRELFSQLFACPGKVKNYDLRKKGNPCKEGETKKSCKLKNSFSNTLQFISVDNSQKTYTEKPP